MAIISGNAQQGQGEYKQALDKYNKALKGKDKVNKIYKPTSKAIQTIGPMLGPVGALIGLGFTVADPIAEAGSTATLNKLRKKVITAKAHATRKGPALQSDLDNSKQPIDYASIVGTTVGVSNSLAESGQSQVQTSGAINHKAVTDSMAFNSQPASFDATPGTNGSIPINTTSGNMNWDTPSSSYSQPSFKYGGFPKGSKGILANQDTSGMTHGKGGPKDDAQPAKLEGGFVVPAEMVDKFFESGIAEKLGLSKHKAADQNQPGGDKVKISPQEYYIDEKKVMAAKAMGVDLNQFAPNAKSPIKEGGSYAPGTIEGKDISKYMTNASDYDFDTNPDLEHLYVKRDKKPSTSTDSNDPGKEANIMNGVFAGLSGAADIGVLAHNLSRRYTNMPVEHVARPDLLPTELDTREQEEQAKVAGNTARTYARNMGVDAATATVGIHAGTLENIQKISQVKQNFRTSQEEKNAGTMNQYRDKVAGTDFNNRMRNRIGFDQFKQAKADSIGNAVTNLKGDAANFMGNKLYIDSSKEGSSVMGNAINDMQYKFASDYKIPSGYSGSKLFEVLRKNGWNMELAAKEIGATKK